MAENPNPEVDNQLQTHEYPEAIKVQLEVVAGLVRDYSLVQVDLWNQVSTEALKSDVQRARVVGGVLCISEWNDVPIAYIDLRTGDILDPRSVMFSIFREKGPEAAGMETLLSLSTRLNELDAQRVLDDLMTGSNTKKDEK